MKEQVKVMIVDDHDMVRVGLRTYIMLDEELTVVEEAANGEEALRKLEALEAGDIPNVMLMDLTMPVMNGIEATREITQRFPSIKIIMLTSFLEEDKVVQAVEAGAISYVLKTISSEQLAQAIKGAATGMPVLNPEVSLALTRGLRQRSAQTEDEGLTAREREVLSLISDGKSNKEIAEALHISIKTVKTHVSNLLMKCELDDRTQLAIYAHRKGWAGTGA
ncbi:response regulator transcription factor [Paenibacillus sp. UNC499MF]|uniref:response regulator n=1 Tax=Paenibacillus sp. UNC499MF TaxID=1502751 RepID=UPI00089FEC55|nr:response regulator transcription factor [Paenibacillus sp. UNC499MF]SEF90751.1 two component transcriptional regulator, LuxR family [Paenibacillus sp. UNC499MF]